MKTILVIDDNESVRKTLRILLGNYDILEGDCVDDGIEILSEYSDINMVITDYEMPDGNGLDILNWVKKNRKGVPVIMMSACEDIKDMAIENGVTYFCLKPCLDIDTILAEIEQN